jgi:hypothetical protein
MKPAIIAASSGAITALVPTRLAIDVAQQDHRHVGGASKAHVGDVRYAQVHFRGRARTFDKHEVGIGRELRKAFQYGAQQLGLHRLILARLGGADDVSLHHDLRAGLALGLQQHRIHVDARRHLGSARL